MKTLIRSLTLLFIVSTTVFAAPPKLAVTAMVPSDMSAVDRAKTAAVTRLLAKAVSSEVTVTARAPIMVSAKCAAERGSAYYSCVFMESDIHKDRRGAGAALPTGTDALLVTVFDPSAQTGVFEGVYYLLARDGNWRSSGFRVDRLTDGRLLIRAHVADQAQALGLDVTPTPVSVPYAKGITWFGDAVLDTPLELK